MSETRALQSLVLAAVSSTHAMVVYGGAATLARASPALFERGRELRRAASDRAPLSAARRQRGRKTLNPPRDDDAQRGGRRRRCRVPCSRADLFAGARHSRPDQPSGLASWRPVSSRLRTERFVFRRRNFRVFYARFVSLMILSQVHLRKPCYDFYFL